MYSRRPGFCKLGCRIILQGRSIGSIYIPATPRPVLSGSQHDTIFKPEATKGLVSLVIGMNYLTANSGVVVDPDDARFRISWDVDGKSIPIQEIFSAAVDGIATTAHYNSNGPCSHVTLVSFSGNVAFHIGQYLGQTLLCKQISTVFGLLVGRVMMFQHKWQEMEFTLNYDGLRIDTGYVLKISSAASHSSNGTEGTTTS